MEENDITQARPTTKRTHRWAFPLGLGIALLALVGAITLLSFGINGIKHLTDKTALKNEYAVFIKNVVRNDPSPFDDISKANMPQLLDSAIWDLIGTGDMALERYEYSESDPIGYKVPQEEVETRFVRLFGSEIKPQHDAVLGAGYTFYYDAVTQEYTIPITGISPIYVPKVYDIDKKGSSIFLTVGFVGYGDWDVDERGQSIEPKPVKFMKITLRERKTDDKDTPSYYIGALQATEDLDVAVASTKKPETSTAPPATQAETTKIDQTNQAGETVDTTVEGQTDENASTNPTTQAAQSTD